MLGITDSDDIYIISYLIDSCGENGVVGYADLAARIYYLQEAVREDEKMSNVIADSLDKFVEKTDDNQLKWDKLRDFMERASHSEIGSMFLTIKTQEREPNKWEYKFESGAPESVLIDKIEGLSERDEALKQKIINAGEIDKQDLYEHVYK